MTMKAIEQRLPESVDGLEDVEVVRSGGPRAAVMPSMTDDMEEMDETKITPAVGGPVRICDCKCVRFPRTY